MSRLVRRLGGEGFADMVSIYFPTRLPWYSALASTLGLVKMSKSELVLGAVRGLSSGSASRIR